MVLSWNVRYEKLVVLVRHRKTTHNWTGQIKLKMKKHGMMFGLDTSGSTQV
jgi:hypothetical protein